MISLNASSQNVVEGGVLEVCGIVSSAGMLMNISLILPLVILDSSQPDSASGKQVV